MQDCNETTPIGRACFQSELPLSKHRLLRIARRRRCRSCYRTGVRKDVSTVCIDCPREHGDGVPLCSEHFQLLHQHEMQLTFDLTRSGIMTNEMAEQVNSVILNETGDSSGISEQDLAFAGPSSAVFPELPGRRPNSSPSDHL
jgi:hypothetical protein